MRFRPCIDLHGGKVKQIIGSTLRDKDKNGLIENFVSSMPPSYYANIFKKDNLVGGHVIMLGPNNKDAAIEAISAWPDGLQVGGGITAENASFWIEKGAMAVIVTSFCFKYGKFYEDNLKRLIDVVGRERLVLDLSCRKGADGRYYVVTDRWQNFTEMAVSEDTLNYLGDYCCEFLVHGVDVEGKCMGIEDDLVKLLGASSPIPATYAGGIQGLEDIEKIKEFGCGRIDFTVGSALDIFGGNLLRYDYLASTYGTH